MMDQILFFIRYGLLLLFGIELSTAFSGVRHTRKNIGILLGAFAAFSVFQLITFFYLGEESVWLLYPLITHLPTFLLLRLVYHKRITTIIAAITSAYACCQPANWFSLLIRTLTNSPVAEHITHIAVSILTAIIIHRLISPQLSVLYSKPSRQSYVFSLVPVVYYIFDYSLSTYSDIWVENSLVASEFVLLMLCVVYLCSCSLYYHEYEKNRDAERKEHLFRITVEQQAKEVETIRRNEQEIRMLRHDMRLLLRNLALCLENEDFENARTMVSSFADNVDSTAIKRYCDSDATNYIISDYASKCALRQIPFYPSVEIAELPIDEVLFANILSNALDNAINAQIGLPPERRCIRMMLKVHNNKFLFSVRNTYANEPKFVDGMPISTKKDHGYGTQSILHLTTRLGGHCQFMLEGGQFVLRIVI